MIAKKDKISKKDIENIMKTGRNQAGEFWNVRYIKNTAQDNSFLVVVGLKGTQKAVWRNRVKRLAYNSIQECKNGLKQGFSVIFLFKGKYLKKNEDKIVSDIKNLLKTVLS